jgi:elongation factor Ts
MEISAEAVKKLRDQTGAGMMDCKKALVEASGDMDAAIKVLRTKGLAAAAKKAHRTASDGMVVVVGDERRMAVLELNCETEPVAQNPTFRGFGRALAEQALATGVSSSEGLRAQVFAAEPQYTVEQALSLKVAAFGENMVLKRVAVVKAEAGHRLASYVHMGGKIGVCVEATTQVGDEALHDVALHVAAADPRFVSRDRVPQALVDAEREIARKQMEGQKKPDHIVDKIVGGRVEKFFADTVLLEQPFAKDPSQSVGQYLRQTGGDGATVTRFVRFRLGEESSD